MGGRDKQWDATWRAVIGRCVLGGVGWVAATIVGGGRERRYLVRTRASQRGV